MQPTERCALDSRPGSVLGPTDPKDAPADSLRGIVAAGWKSLGLKAPCNGGDNAVHASASPFEGLAERTNWLAVSIADDPFGKALLEAGVPEATIKKWSSDPQVRLPRPSHARTVPPHLGPAMHALCVRVPRSGSG